MSKFVVGFVAVACVLTVSAYGQSRVVFDNQSGDPALVKLIGPTKTEVEVPNGAKVGTDATGGRYLIKVRYGTPGNYHYSKGDEFTVTETATAKSETTITLHKVVAGNYDSRPITADDFNAGRPPDKVKQPKDADQKKEKGATSQIVITLVNSTPGELTITLGSQDTTNQLTLASGTTNRATLKSGTCSVGALYWDGANGAGLAEYRQNLTTSEHWTYVTETDLNGKPMLKKKME